MYDLIINDEFIDTYVNVESLESALLRKIDTKDLMLPDDGLHYEVRVR